MPAKIIIDGVIGWDVTTSDIRNQLSDASGDSLDIQISSPGGSVYQGFTIKQMIEKYKEDHPLARVKMTSFGISASMASIIALAGDEHVVHDDTTYLIHNPWSGTIGDYREMKKAYESLERLAEMGSRVYSKKTGKSNSEIRHMMDEETILYGDEIVKSGFADRIINNNSSSDKNEKVEFAKLAIDDAKSRMQSTKDFDFVSDCLKVVALIGDNKIQNPASAGIKQTEGKRMTLDELKKDHPDLYAQVVQIGKDQEFDRVNAHILLGTQAGCLDIAAKNISEKKEFSQSVSAEYMAAGMKNRSLQDRKEDDPGVINTPAQEDEPAETQAYTNKLLAHRGVKNGK